MSIKKYNIVDFFKNEVSVKDYCKKNIFGIIKALTLLLRQNTKGLEQYNYIWLNINIYEAVISDIIQNKDFLNALYGFNLTLLWPVMKHINILNGEGIKLWCILYFIWNMKFCKNKGYSKIDAFSHNFPALYKTLLSSGYTSDELLNNWGYLREISLITAVIVRKDTQKYTK